MHHSDGLRLDNDAQSFVDVHFAPEGKTHANFNNSNDNFNNDSCNFNNNHTDTVKEFYETVDEEMPGRGKFVSSPSLSHKSIQNERNFVTEDKKSSKRGSKNSIENYYEKYSVQTAKILINTLFLPSQKICQYCAVANKSVVYSDRLVYENRFLEARLVDCFCQFYTKQLIFNQKNLFGGDSRDYMPVFNVKKTNHSGLSYSLVEEPDIFDLNTLGPSILLVGTLNDLDTEGESKLGKIDNLVSNHGNTDYYHRRMIDNCSRISRKNIFRPKVFNNVNLEARLRSEEAKNVDCDDEIQYWMDFNEDTRLLSTKNSDEMFNLSAARLHNHNYNYSHNHRASLLMLEPILMMPDLENTNKRRSNKKRITRSEHVKIVRIVIAYTLSFFLLAIVTFYIVYFV
ncbi:uncharacterized protein LOC123262002 [Cotesia glomerata]|uniref:Uncharacterized protein n=1 Tax=Cotesia glomerata TaxID=32391 RepID=A0AAV7IJ35_COTGL|nr:uncharacterized protein LOC123262002 [Cotesia glomerata]KAH0550449.1 hypothetical protein KQX54_019453 [Cotesia glomerata]